MADNKPKAKLPAVAQASYWGTLSSHKLAYIQACTKDGEMDGSSIVMALLTDGDLSIDSQYQSPFESSSPETRLPTLLGMLQSGEIATTLARSAEGSGLLGQAVAGVANMADSAAKAMGFSSFEETAESLEGKTNLTKLNSTQIFVSTSAVRMSITLFFSAFHNAEKEVESQLKQLKKWVVPKKLARSLFESVAEDGLIGGLFPSEAPPYVALTYGGKTYKPFFIESVSEPLVAPSDRNGNRLSLSVSVSLVSRQAWDASNII